MTPIGVHIPSFSIGMNRDFVKFTVVVAFRLPLLAAEIRFEGDIMLSDESISIVCLVNVY